MRAGMKMGDTSLVDTCIKDGLMDAFHSYHMGVTGREGKVQEQTASKTQYADIYIWH